MAGVKNAVIKGLLKTPSGIIGLDEITGGGLPRGRPTLVCGFAGSGKTLLGMEFLVRGATQFGESGVIIAFEETGKELIKNVESLGFDIEKLVREKKFLIDYVHIERSEILETGEYDLQGLFIRLEDAINQVKAKRVVMDSLEALFSGLTNESILRAELRRLFRWLKEKGVTAIITAERGIDTLTRHGLEEYVSDCVILLDHRIIDHVATRHLRVVKYRGSSHGTNEYPFLIDETGFSVLPVTSLHIEYEASMERVSSGVSELDAMRGGKGFFCGSTILVSGTAGSGKTSVAGYFVDAACRRGEKCIYFAFEESASQNIRNMRSIGLDLQHWVKKGLLRFVASRPSMLGLEMHLVAMHKQIVNFEPRNVVLDPITDFESAGSRDDAKAMLLRLVDFLKVRQVTALFTSLTREDVAPGSTEAGISSLIDTWLLLRNLEQAGERNRGLYILKSRGMSHSNQIREFLLTDNGVQLVNVCLGPDGILTGSARMALGEQEQAEALTQRQAVEAKRKRLAQKRTALEAKIKALKAEFEADAQAIELEIGQTQAHEVQVVSARSRQAASRSGSDKGVRPSGKAKKGVTKV